MRCVTAHPAGLKTWPFADVEVSSKTTRTFRELNPGIAMSVVDVTASGGGGPHIREFLYLKSLLK